jgi:hypothetical protein
MMSEICRTWGRTTTLSNRGFSICFPLVFALWGLSGLIGGYVVNRQGNQINLHLLTFNDQMLTAPIFFVLVHLLRIKPTDAHDLLGAVKLTVPAIRIHLSHSKPPFLFGQ